MKVAIFTTSKTSLLGMKSAFISPYHRTIFLIRSDNSKWYMTHILRLAS